MVNDQKKTTFCQSNKCTFCVFIIIACLVAAVVCATILDHNLRDIYDHGESKDELKWWQTTIIYQIYPRSFQDSNDDGVGDLKGILSRLSYFNDLKVGAIWLSPFFTSPMRDFGYDVSNYTEVDPLFGNMKDFDTLMTEAHAKGIKVIIDFVPNHTSNESVWFERSRNAKDQSDPYWDFYIWNKGTQGKPPNNWKSVFGGSAWEWDIERQAYYYHAFLTSQPDLNYRNEDVLNKMDEVLRFWMDKGVDGVRIDAIPHLFEIHNQSVDEPPGASNGFDEHLHMYTKNQPEVFDVVKRWKAILDEYEAADGNKRFLLCETVGIPQSARMSYYEAGSVPFFFNLIPAKDACHTTTAKCFLEVIKDGMNLTAGQWPNFVIGNHDNKRIADRIGDAYVDAMNMMLLTLPGTPTTYYGEELGMRGGNYTGRTPEDPYARTSHDYSNSRDSERNPMQWDTSLNAGFTNKTDPWLPITSNTDFGHINVKVEMNMSSSSLSLYRRLAEIRQRPAFQNNYINLPDDRTGIDEILVYIRGNAGDRYAVALNLGNYDSGIDISKYCGYATGMLIFSTRSQAKHSLKLSNIQLRVGEGVIIHLET